MKKLASKPHPVAEIPHPPLPLIMTITATRTLFAYSLCGPPEIKHRRVQPCDLGSNDGLIAAIVQALATLTPVRTSRLLATHQATGSLPRLPEDSEPLLLPISIRTENQDLIVAGEFLQTEAPQTTVDASTPLRNQLHRFDIEWQQLPLETEELKALQRWGEVNCVLGRAFHRNEETRADYRAAVATFEAVDRDEAHLESDAEADETEAAA